MNARILHTIISFAAAGLLALPIGAADAESPKTVSCASTPGQRQHCPADTSAGVALVATKGDGPCLLGKTWGYDDAGVWVSDGCAGEFVLGQAAPKGAAATAPTSAAETPQPAAPEQKRQPSPRVERWGEFEPGDGFLVGRNSAGELSISAYALVRYINQTPAEQTFTDHLGDERQTDGRNDIFPHRVMIFFRGGSGTRSSSTPSSSGP